MMAENRGERGYSYGQHHVGAGAALDTASENALVHGAQFVQVVAEIGGRARVHEGEHRAYQQGGLVMGNCEWTGQYRYGLSVLTVGIGEKQTVRAGEHRTGLYYEVRAYRSAADEHRSHGTADYRPVEETETALEDGGLSYSHVPDDAYILYSGPGADRATLRCRCPGTEIRHGLQPLCQFRTVPVHGRQIGRRPPVSGSTLTRVPTPKDGTPSMYIFPTSQI